MKSYLVILVLMFSIFGFSNRKPAMEFISYWKVYNGGKLIEEKSTYIKDSRIILTKGKIRVIDTLMVKYFDDSLCVKCIAKIIIKSKDGKYIRTIDNSKSNYVFEIKTTDLQFIAHKNRSSVLKFYFKSDEFKKYAFLFEIEIK